MWLSYLVATLFLLYGAVCVGLVVIQMPGTWLLLGGAALVEVLDRLYLPEGATQTFGWPVLGTALGLAVLGEIVEFAAGAEGARRGGASARGVWGAVIGGIVGVFAFTPIFFWVPFFGMFLGALLGTFLGAVVGELTAERGSLRGSLRPAAWAAVGRVIGTWAKVAIAVAMWVVLSVGAFWPGGPPTV